MSIRTKILLACLSLTAVTLALGALTLSAQDKLGNMAVHLYDETFMSMSYLRSAQNTLTMISQDAAAGTTRADEFEDRLENALGDTEVSRARAFSAEGKQAAAQLSAQLQHVARDYRVTHRLPDRKVLAELENGFETAVEVNAADGFHARRRTAELIDRLALETWIALALSVAIALTITLVLSRMIVPAVRHAVGIATAIASGRLDNRIEARGRSETSVLLRALSSMQSSIAEKITCIEELRAEEASAHADEMASQHVRFETALDNMVQGLCMFDDCGRVLVHNRRFADMFAAAPAGTLAREAVPATLLSDPAAINGPARLRSFTRELDDERTIAVVEQSMDDGGWVATYEDVTERHRTEARMAFMARHDALTGLPNRVLYGERMEHALARVRRGASLAVLCLDVDHFKVVNDTLGHSVGDGLLQAVGKRLRSETRETDTVIRLGGDEFAIIQIADGQPTEAETLAERLVATLSEPFQINEHDIAISACIGIAIATDGHITAETLLKNADLALNRAKADGHGTYRFFEAEMDARMQARRRIELDLRQAIAERQFENYYQPLVTVATCAVSGFEALVRWQHPTRGMISPGEFIPVAEDTGLISQIGSLVLRRACLDALKWPASVKIAVNLSPIQFRNRHLAREVATALEQSGLPASRLELEITESVLLQDGEAVLDILHEIRALGVHISMDDFGTGYSSLSYLRRFPFDKIKIDQSFVRNLEHTGDCIAIVRAVLGLGKSLGMQVVAEGVETKEQLAILQAEGCEQVQGYLFSRPKPIDALETRSHDRSNVAA